MKRSEFFLLLFFFLFAIASFYSSMGGGVLVLPDEKLPSHVYSMIIAGFLGVSSFIRLAFQLAKSIKINKEGSSEKTNSSSLKVPLLFMLVSVVYIVGISKIGFYITTAVVIYITYWGLEGFVKSRIRSGIVFSLGMCALLFVLFKFLNIYLPNALLF